MCLLWRTVFIQPVTSYHWRKRKRVDSHRVLQACIDYQIYSCLLSSWGLWLNYMGGGIGLKDSRVRVKKYWSTWSVISYGQLRSVGLVWVNLPGLSKVWPMPSISTMGWVVLPQLLLITETCWGLSIPFIAIWEVSLIFNWCYSTWALTGGWSGL